MFVCLAHPFKKGAVHGNGLSIHSCQAALLDSFYRLQVVPRSLGQIVIVEQMNGRTPHIV